MHSRRTSDANGEEPPAAFTKPSELVADGPAPDAAVTPPSSRQEPAARPVDDSTFTTNNKYHIDDADADAKTADATDADAGWQRDEPRSIGTHQDAYTDDAHTDGDAATAAAAFEPTLSVDNSEAKRQAELRRLLDEQDEQHRSRQRRREERERHAAAPIQGNDPNAPTLTHTQQLIEAERRAANRRGGMAGTLHADAATRQHNTKRQMAIDQDRAERLSEIRGARRDRRDRERTNNRDHRGL